MIELSPTAWIHYLVILFLPMMLIVEDFAASSLFIRPLTLATCSYLLSFGVFLVLFVGGTTRTIVEESSSVSLLLAWVAVYFLASFNRSTRTTNALDPPAQERRLGQALASG